MSISRSIASHDCILSSLLNKYTLLIQFSYFLIKWDQNWPGVGRSLSIRPLTFVFISFWTRGLLIIPPPQTAAIKNESRKQLYRIIASPMCFGFYNFRLMLWLYTVDLNSLTSLIPLWLAPQGQPSLSFS